MDATVTHPAVSRPRPAAVATVPRPEEPETEIIARAKTSRSAFDTLYERHAPGVYRYLCRRLGDPAMAEDVLHDVFLSVLRALPRYEERRTTPFRHWLLRIATNAANKAANKAGRRRGRTVSMQTIDTGSLIGETDVERRSETGLARALRTLPVPHQSALVLHHVEGLSVEHVASVLGCRVGTVKSRLHRGRAALKTAIEREES